MAMVSLASPIVSFSVPLEIWIDIHLLLAAAAGLWGIDYILQLASIAISKAFFSNGVG